MTTQFFQTFSGPFLIDTANGTFVCVQVTRSSNAGAELHVLNGLPLEGQHKLETVSFHGAPIGLFA